MQVSRRGFLSGSIASVALMFGSFGWRPEGLLKAPVAIERKLEHWNWCDISRDQRLTVFASFDLDKKAGTFDLLETRYWDTSMGRELRHEIDRKEAIGIDPRFVSDSDHFAVWNMDQALKRG